MVKVIFLKKSGNSYLEGNIENCKSQEQSDLTEIIKVKQIVRVKFVLFLNIYEGLPLTNSRPENFTKENCTCQCQCPLAKNHKDFQEHIAEQVEFACSSEGEHTPWENYEAPQ